MRIFLSETSDICKGLNPESDYYFPALGQVIYYNTKEDTIVLYTRPLAKAPKKFGVTVVQVHISAQEDNKYEQMYQQNKIGKVVIDSLIDPGCNVSF